MDQATYGATPETLEMREIRYHVVQPGYRSQTITIATTLTDAEVYSQEDIAKLYGFRWNSELDIRSIKQSLNLSRVRCKSPEMVHKELWTTMLAYNLIRTTTAAFLHDKQPRQISFTSTCQDVLLGMDASFMPAVYCGSLEKPCPRDVKSDHRLRSRKSPRQIGTASPQSSASRLQAHARIASRLARRTAK
ncbi:MAG: transposase [Planctomycetota bacterium]|nr:transposase [Planctomycetota bacterium]